MLRERAVPATTATERPAWRVPLVLTAGILAVIILAAASVLCFVLVSPEPVHARGWIVLGPRAAEVRPMRIRTLIGSMRRTLASPTPPAPPEIRELVKSLRLESDLNGRELATAEAELAAYTHETHPSPPPHWKWGPVEVWGPWPESAVTR